MDEKRLAFSERYDLMHITLVGIRPLHEIVEYRIPELGFCLLHRQNLNSLRWGTVGKDGRDKKVRKR
jgi:hypothetical protein